MIPDAARSAIEPFLPKPWLRNAHAMTVYAWARRRRFPGLPPPEARLFRVSGDTQVLAHCHWQPQRAGRPTLMALHGLEGSSSVHYMRGLADKAFRQAWNVVLLNQRNCGGTEHLTPGLYHSGLTADPLAVIRALAAEALAPIVVVGYSLGGNLAVKLAGELDAEAQAGASVAGVAAVCPTIDLDTCVRSIERRTNLPYHWNFVRNLRARMRRKARSWPDAFDLSRLDRIWTIRTFDEVYTAPHHGFDGASDYYHRASALRVVDRIRLPVLILAADDDPFVPPSQLDGPAVRSNPAVIVQRQRHGGHCGFVAPAAPGFDGYWAEAAAVAFLDRVLRSRGAAPRAAS